MEFLNKCAQALVLFASNNKKFPKNISKQNSKSGKPKFESKFYILQDIELAFEHGYPEELHYKLHDRRGKCYTQLHEKNNAINAFQQAKDLLKLVCTNPVAYPVWKARGKRTHIVVKIFRFHAVFGKNLAT